MIGAMMDVTERKRDEQALKENHQLLRAVIEGTTDAVYMKDLQGRYVMVNSTVARVFGRSFEEIVGRNDIELLPYETAMKITEDDRRIMSAGETKTFEEVVTINATTQTYLSTKGPWRNHQGRSSALSGSAAISRSENRPRNRSALLPDSRRFLPNWARMPSAG